METKEFKKIFGQLAKKYGFIQDFGGWYKTSEECVLTVQLQKSSYSRFFYMNMNVFIHGVFHQTFIPNKEIMRSNLSSIFQRQPVQYDDIFDLENALDTDARVKLLEQFFKEYLAPFSEKILTRAGIKQLAMQKEIILFPPVLAALGWDPKSIGC